ncbi:Outer-membrane lipoprotein carrier protein [Hydrogenovibrio crunogenus]|uniref:Outer-membrane lipoprotein carrier protein n=1 Tax=Hydrogenovibrio crunogenus TaxID=39765 RepID=A0A4P7NY96_9GAMM|nr:outer membrane lipoprotein chaperone LolA [Hydrogenovibrio crunogenus]QBZ82727.1 Outer-membrane lipoprotein carrier protein [Hydrogenovibrio crunogenus]RUM90322.1 MAG: outer membrane lipoprotein carrier protein LolA [Thiomicrospira sp.]
MLLKALLKQSILRLSMACMLIVPIIVSANERAKLSDLNAFVANLDTFSAKFEQTQPDESLFALNRSTGYFAMKRPGQLLWVYEKPEPQKIIADGRNVWVYDVDLDQATVRALANVEADFPLSWLLYREPLSERFNIIPGSVKDGVSWYNLTPKEGTFFQSLEVAIANGKMVQIWMYQNADNVTKVVFNDIKQNQPVRDQQFDFHPPKGVDVIGQALP